MTLTPWIESHGFDIDKYGVPPVFRDSLCPHGGGARFC